jgi:uncharacterized membrane protein YoaK (UPF0700 family)
MAMKSGHTGWGMACGALLGAIAGVAAGHLALWLGIGIAIGIVLAAAFRREMPTCSQCAAIHKTHTHR